MAHRFPARKRAAQLSTEQLEAEGYANERGNERQAAPAEQAEQACLTHASVQHSFKVHLSPKPSAAGHQLNQFGK